MSLDSDHTTDDLSLEDLKNAISPGEIAYISEGGAVGIRSLEVCRRIRTVDNSDTLQALLEHSKTLRAPHGKEFPIGRIRSAIVGRLAELDVLTSQNG